MSVHVRWYSHAAQYFSGRRISITRLLPILLAWALSQATALASHAYVSRCCGAAGSISAFNPGTNQLTGTFITAPGAIDMVLSPAGTRAYVAIPATDTGSVPPHGALVEYLLSTGKAVQSIPLPASPIQLAINAAGDHVYAAAIDSQGAQRVVSVDLTTAKAAIAPVTQITPFDLFAVAVSPDGKTLYTALGAKLFTLDAATLAITGSIALTATAGPIAAEITPDGATLAVLVGNVPSCALDIVSLATAQVKRAPLATASVPFGAVLSPDGGTVYVNGRGVCAVDLANAAVTGTAVTNSQNPARIAITPEGATGTTSVIDTASLSVTIKISTLSDVAAVAITPQGQGYFLNRDGSQVVQVDGSAMKATGVVPAGAQPSQILAGSNGKAFVLNLESSNLSVIPNGISRTSVPVPIALGVESMTFLQGLLMVNTVEGLVGVNPNTLKIVEGITIPVPRNSFATTIVGSPSGQDLFAAYTLAGDDGVWIGGGLVILNTQTMSGTPVSAGAIVSGPLAISPDGQTVYMVGSSLGKPPANTVVVVNVASAGIAQTASFGSANYVASAISRDGSTLYCADSGGKVDLIATGTLSVSASIAAGVQPSGIALSPDGTQALITDAVSTAVTVIDLTKNQVSGTIPVGATSQSAAYLQ